MDFDYETPNQIPFPDKLVGWYDIFKGLGQIALDVLTDRHHFRNVVDMYDQSSWTPVQKDAAEWMDKIG